MKKCSDTPRDITELTPLAGLIAMRLFENLLGLSRSRLSTQFSMPLWILLTPLSSSFDRWIWVSSIRLAVQFAHSFRVLFSPPTIPPPFQFDVGHGSVSSL